MNLESSKEIIPNLTLLPPFTSAPHKCFNEMFKKKIVNFSHSKMAEIEDFISGGLLFIESLCNMDKH